VADTRPLAAVDIDGVVADVRHRLHHLERRPKDWRAFFAAAPADPPHQEGLAVVARLLEEHHEVVFLTGRPERLRAATRSWLQRHGLGGHRLVMRPPHDRRPAAVVKVELLEEVRAGRPVAVVVDDDRRVLAAMTQAGHPTFHADWERRDAAEQQVLLEAQETEGRT
jgi:hypothetical protein